MKTPPMTAPPRDPLAETRHGSPAGGHLSVLLNEAIAWLDPKPGGRYCDATVGAGGHAAAVLERSAPDGRLIGLDRDPAALAIAGAHLQPFGDRVTLVHARFSEARAVLERLDMIPVDGFLVDLGVSSPQLDRAERGFSFRNDGPLDMRMDPTTGETAAELLRRVDEEELTRIIRDHGEERHAARVARAIIAARNAGPVETTGKLAAIVARALPRRPDGKSPATRTFQALRIAVNDEIGALERVLPKAVRWLAKGARIVVIAFHSGEDRVVKRFFRERAASGELEVLTRKIVEPGPAEVEANPRSRSAKLRAARRT